MKRLNVLHMDRRPDQYKSVFSFKIRKQQKIKFSKELKNNMSRTIYYFKECNLKRSDLFSIHCRLMGSISLHIVDQYNILSAHLALFQQPSSRLVRLYYIISLVTIELVQFHLSSTVRSIEFTDTYLFFRLVVSSTP